MAFIQAEKDEAVDVESKKEVELLDPNDPHSLALFKKQALEHEARWNAMSREEKEVSLAKRSVDYTEYEFTEEEINHIYGDSHEALLEEGLHEAAASLMAEWTEVKTSMSTDRRRLKFRMSDDARAALSGSCQGSSAWSMGECIASFDQIVDGITKAEAYVKAKTEPFCGLADELTEYNPFNLNLGDAKIGLGKRSNADELCGSLDMHKCDTHAWMCIASYGTICFTDACARDTGRCVQENFSTFANWANVAVSLAGLFFTGGASSVATNAATKAATQAVKQGAKQGLKNAARSAANPFMTNAANPFINPFFKSANAGIAAAQKAGSKTLSRQVARSFTSGTLSDSAATATRASISNTMKQTGFRAAAANMKKNLYNYFWAEVKDTIKDELMHLVAEEMIFMAVVGEQKTVISKLGDLAWELAELVDPTGISSLARYYIERPECIFDKPILKAADVQGLMFQSVGLKPFESYQPFSTCPISNHLGYWNSPNACVESEAMLKCESKKFQWRSGEDMCSCCFDSDKTKYKPDPCVGLVDGGCARDDGYTLANMDQKTRRYGFPSQRLNVLNPWNVYSANDMAPCPKDYILTFSGDANGGCVGVDGPLFEESVASLAACAAMCTNFQNCRTFNYKNEVCVGIGQCSNKQQDGNGEISCTRNPCPENWVPYFAGSFSGGCETTEDSVDKEGTMRIELADLTAAECAQKCSNLIDCMAIEMMDRSDPIHRPDTSRCTLIKKCLRQTQEFQTLTCRPIFETHCPEGYIHREGWQQPNFIGLYQMDRAFLTTIKDMTRTKFYFRTSDNRTAMLRQIRDNGNERFTTLPEYSAFTMEDCKMKCETTYGDTCTAFQFSPRMKNCFIFDNISKPNGTSLERDFRFCARDGYAREKCESGGITIRSGGTSIELTVAVVGDESPGLVVNSGKFPGFWGTIEEGAKQFSDRKYVLTDVPHHLLGAKYWLGPCHSRGASLTIKTTGTVYLLASHGNGRTTKLTKFTLDPEPQSTESINMNTNSFGARGFEQWEWSPQPQTCRTVNAYGDKPLIRKTRSIGISSYCEKASEKESDIGKVLGFKGIDMCTACQGECENDSECAGSLKCYIRDNEKTAFDADEGNYMHYRQPVPGCMSNEEQKKDVLLMWHKSTHQRDDLNYCYDPHRFKKDCSYTAPVATRSGHYICKASAGSGTLATWVSENFWHMSALWIWDGTALQKTQNTETEQPSEFDSYKDSNPKWYYKDNTDFYSFFEDKRFWDKSGANKAKRSTDRGFLVEDEDECRRACDGRVECEFYLYLAKKPTSSRRCYLGKNYKACNPIEANEGLFHFTKIQQKTCRHRNAEHSGYRQRPNANIKCKKAKFMANNVVNANSCGQTAMHYQGQGIKHFSYNEYTGQCFLSEACDDTYQEKNYLYNYLGFGKCDGVFEAVQGKDESKVTVLKMHQYLQKRQFKELNDGEAIQEYYISDELECERACNADDECKYFMAGATKFEEDNLCYLWKTDCTLMVPPRQMRFLDIDPPLNGWSLDLADAKKFTDVELFKKHQQGHWRLPSKSTSEHQDDSFARFKKGFVVKEKVVLESDNKGFNWEVYDLVPDADTKTYEHAEFDYFDNYYCPEVCELCKDGDQQLVNGRCHEKCSFDGKCGSIGTDCSGCSHRKHAKKSAPFILESDTGEFCDGSGVDSKVKSRKECEEKANSVKANFYNYAKEFGPHGEEITHCKHSHICIPDKRKKVNDIPWQIYRKPQQYKRVASDKKCVKGTSSAHIWEKVDELKGLIPKQSRRTLEACQTLAMWYGFQYFSFKAGSDDVGYCEIARLQNCMTPEDNVNWEIYSRGYPRVEEESALASFKESDSVEEPEVIDITENLKFTPGLQESVPTLEMIEPKFSMIQVFAVIGVIFISYSAYKRCNKSDYVDVPSGVEAEEI